MLQILKQVTVGFLILLIVPVGILLTGWQWQPDGSSNLLKLALLITESAGAPWAALTCIVLALWFAQCVKLPLKKTLQLIGLLAAAVLAGLAVKSAVKDTLQAPRPFVVWMEARHQIDDKYFYSLTRTERALLIREELQSSDKVPAWLYQYWERETGYSFPSGHALFAAGWALLAVGLLWRQRCYITVTLLMAWEVVIGVSRLVLGMHWPVDLILATAIAWLITLVACYAAKMLALIDTEENPS